MLPGHKVEIPCPSNSEGCKYAPNCHTSIHHNYGRELGKQAVGEALAEGDTDRARVAKRFVNHPLNKWVVCRQIHDFLDRVAPTELPSTARMERFLDANG